MFSWFCISLCKAEADRSLVNNPNRAAGHSVALIGCFFPPDSEVQLPNQHFTSKFNLSHSFPEFFLPWTPKVESWAPGRPWERCEQQEAWVTLASCLAGDEATRELLLRELARSRDGYLVRLELIPAHMAEDGGGGGRAVGASPWVLWVRWEGWTGNVCQSRISCERAETRKHAAWIPNIFRCKSLNSEASLLFSPFLNIGWISLFLVSELFQLISRRAGGRGNIWFKFLW